MIHIGLFEGIGGFSLAAHQMGWETLVTCEINPFGQQVLQYYWPDAYHHSDIHTLNYGTINAELSRRFGPGWRDDKIILTGGFPCQPFSMAGKRKGTDDERHLWPETIRIIREVQPDWIVCENVAGLLTILEPESISEVESEEIRLFSSDENYPTNSTIERVQRRVIATIIEEIRSEGYVLPTYSDGTPIVFCLPACAVNAPHRRDRVWFVAHADSGRHARSTEIGRDSQYVERKGESGSSPHTTGAGGGQNNGGGKSGLINQKSQITDWSNFPTQPPVRGRDDGLPSRLVGITVSKHRNESIKAYGNAVVPPLVYAIFKSIQEYNESI